MATATAKKKPVKKSTAKKTVAKKAPVKKTVVAKTAVKKTSPKRTAKKNSEIRSFKVSKDQQAFTSFRITRQTIYWIILVAFIIFAQLWIIKLQVEVASLLDIQQTNLSLNSN